MTRRRPKPSKMRVGMLTRLDAAVAASFGATTNAPQPNRRVCSRLAGRIGGQEPFRARSARQAATGSDCAERAIRGDLP